MFSLLSCHNSIYETDGSGAVGLYALVNVVFNKYCSIHRSTYGHHIKRPERPSVLNNPLHPLFRAHKTMFMYVCSNHLNTSKMKIKRRESLGTMVRTRVFHCHRIDIDCFLGDMYEKRRMAVLQTLYVLSGDFYALSCDICAFVHCVLRFYRISNKYMSHIFIRIYKNIRFEITKKIRNRKIARSKYSTTFVSNICYWRVCMEA